MDQQQFQRQMSRLSDTFGANSYKDERIKILWREIQDFSIEWLARTVDHFIGSCRHAPLMPEFREELSKERERMHSVQKREHREDAKEFKTSYPAEDIKTICEQIRRRITGSMDDQDYQGFMRMITPLGGYRCRRCEDTGIYRNELMQITACDCRKNGSR